MRSGELQNCGSHGGKEKVFAPAGNQTPSVQHIASHYTDRTTPYHKIYRADKNIKIKILVLICISKNESEFWKF
jgi:hypothetical protein